MAVQGNLKDMNLTSLISVNCNEMNQARLRIVNQNREARLFFEDGNVVHASLAGREGAEVVYEVLGWSEGQFVLEPDVAAPRRSIDTHWSELVLEGLNRIDEQTPAADGATWESDELESIADDLELPATGEESRGPASIATKLRALSGVAGAVVVARDGIVLAADMEIDPEKEGAVAVFVGSAASQIGDALQLGPFLTGVVEMGSDKTRVVVIDQPDYYIGLLLEERASPGLVLQSVQDILS